jgi:hypothetical protein
VTLLDVCPTVLTLLGVPVGQDMDGAPVLHMFESPPEVASVPSHEPEQEGDGVHRGDAAEDCYSAHETLKQLVALGTSRPLQGTRRRRSVRCCATASRTWPRSCSRRVGLSRQRLS